MFCKSNINKTAWFLLVLLKYGEVITVKSLKSKRKKIMLVEKYGWAVQKSLFAETNQNSTFSHACENSKMFSITSKYFSFFNNKHPVSWVARITRDSLTCYFYSYYISMLLHASIINIIAKWFITIAATATTFFIPISVFVVRIRALMQFML